jgi:CubicO group peptidase (beta-lactamase class C family)
MKKCIMIVLSLLMLVGSIPSYATTKDLESEIRQILEDNNTTAVSIAIIDADGKEKTLAIGVADKTTNKPVDADTFFRIGSISKMFVTLSVLKLAEEGKLELNDPIRYWVEEVEFYNPWEDDHPVRIVHLLSHTSGWDDLHFSEYANNDPTPLALESSFSVYPKSRTSRWVPGSRMSYSNSGPGVAAYIVEKLTGMPYEDYVESAFFKPIGMNTATFFQSEDYINNSATLYQRDVEQPYWNIIMRPSGSVNASANDMLQLLKFFIYGSDQSILQEESIEDMRHPTGSIMADSGLEVGHGLSHFIETKDGFTWYGHNGGVNGGISDFKYIPELKIGYYVAINSSSGKAIHEISELLKSHLTEDFTPQTIPYEVDETVDTKDLAGYFRAVNPRNNSLFFIEYLASVGRIESRPEGLALVGILDGSVDLYSPINETQYVDPNTGRIALTVAQDPLLGTVLLNEWFTLQPVSFLSVYGPIAFLALWLVATVLIVLRLIIALILKALRKPIKGRIWTHVLPLLQILSIGMFVRGFMGVMAVDFLADNRLVSGLMAYGTILFLVISFGSVVWFIVKRERNFSYYQSLAYSVMSLIVSIYLTNMGITGYHFF